MTTSKPRYVRTLLDLQLSIDSPFASTTPQPRSSISSRTGSKEKPSLKTLHSQLSVQALAIRRSKSHRSPLLLPTGSFFPKFVPTQSTLLGIAHSTPCTFSSSPAPTLPMQNHLSIPRPDNSTALHCTKTCTWTHYCISAMRQDGTF